MRLKKANLFGLLPAVVFAAVFLALSALIFWRCRYGFGSNDEAFYLTVPYRLMQGDALVAEEWNLAQLFGLLLLPFMRLFYLFNDNAQGMILWFRYLYSASQCLMALFIYYRLRKTEPWAAGLAAAVFLVFAPNGIMALSYITLGTDLLLIACLIMLGYEGQGRLLPIAAGLSFAGAVLCCPYLVLGYVLYGAFSLHALVKGRRELWRSFIWLTLGCVLAAALFLAFLLSRASLEDIIRVLPYMLTEPTHSQSALEKAASYPSAILSAARDGAWIYSALALLLCAALLAGRKSPRLAPWIFFSALALCLILLVETRSYINYLAWPVCILACFVPALSRDRQVHRLFTRMYLPGMLYTFLIYLGSNQRYFIITAAALVPAVSAIMMVGLYLRELASRSSGKRAAVPYLLAGPLALYMLLQLCVLRADFVYPASHRDQQLMYISDGLDAGLLVTDGLYYGYYSLCQDIGELCSTGAREVLMYSNKTWYYFLGDGLRINAYSAWLALEAGPDMTAEKTLAYYSIYPDKLPEAVYMDYIYEDQRIMGYFCTELGYSSRELLNGWLLTQPGL